MTRSAKKKENTQETAGLAAGRMRRENAGKNGQRECLAEFVDKAIAGNVALQTVQQKDFEEVEENPLAPPVKKQKGPLLKGAGQSRRPPLALPPSPCRTGIFSPHPTTPVTPVQNYAEAAGVQPPAHPKKKAQPAAKVHHPAPNHPSTLLPLFRPAPNLGLHNMPARGHNMQIPTGNLMFGNNLNIVQPMMGQTWATPDAGGFGMGFNNFTGNAQWGNQGGFNDMQGNGYPTHDFSE